MCAMTSAHTQSDTTTNQPTSVSQPGIEVNTVSRPHLPVEPASSPDDDPTGVRALLSSLPEPDPMPAYLVERINASLNAEQSQRAASFNAGLVTPLVATSRRRPGRVLFAMAGAAAVVLVAVVGTNLFGINQQGASTTSAASIASAPHGASSPAPQGAYDKAAPDAASTPAVIQIRVSATQYTKADFTAQARTLSSAVFGASAPKAAEPLAAGRMDTEAGLSDCLRAVGVTAKTVRADLAFYEGAPAVIIVATTKDGPIAYAVARQCSLAGAAVLHPATPLP